MNNVGYFTVLSLQRESVLPNFFLALNGIHGRTTVLRWISVDILHCFVDGFGNKTRIDYGTGVYMLLVGVDLSDENWGKLEA